MHLNPATPAVGAHAIVEGLPGPVKHGVIKLNSNAQIMLMDRALYAGTDLEQIVLPQLHADEQARYRAFTNLERRRNWLAGRALLLAALQHELGEVDPAALRTRPEGGVCYGAAGINLNLSHSGDWFAVALSRNPVGIDIEWPRPRKLIENVADYFAEEEVVYLQALPEAQRQQAFYRFWTLKEAACKSVGLSLWQTLRHTVIDLASRRVVCAPPFPAGSWSFLSARLEPGWCLAIAIHGVSRAIDANCRRLVAPQQWQAQQLAEIMSLQGESLPADTLDTKTDLHRSSHA
jgi:4'-phosphopantetheinyl transferase